MDVSEEFLGDMLAFLGESRRLLGRPLGLFDASLTVWLGHENAYVGASSAALISAAVEHRPQTGHKTADALQALYREKVRPCRFVLHWSCPEFILSCPVID